MSVFKDFEFNIVINIVYRYKVNFLSLLLLTFADLLADIYYTVQYIVGGKGLIIFCKGG